MAVGVGARGDAINRNKKKSFIIYQVITTAHISDKKILFSTATYKLLIMRMTGGPKSCLSIHKKKKTH